ncbi:unnamed protein product [Ectocarpus sp. 8 AP-2014]
MWFTTMSPAGVRTLLTRAGDIGLARRRSFQVPATLRTRCACLVTPQCRQSHLCAAAATQPKGRGRAIPGRTRPPGAPVEGFIGGSSRRWVSTFEEDCEVVEECHLLLSSRLDIPA